MSRVRVRWGTDWGSFSVLPRIDLLPMMDFHLPAWWRGISVSIGWGFWWVNVNLKSKRK